jgi:hypothetical protein
MALFTTPRATFTDLTARTARIAETDGTGEVPAASWTNGSNDGSCSSAGIGFAFIDPDGDPQGVDLTGSPEQFTLEDQFENTRTPQVSQSIGGLATVPRTGNVATTWDTTQVLYTKQGATSSGGLGGYGTQPVEGVTNPTQSTIDGDPITDGKVTVAGAATLTTLAAGWVVTP